MKSKLRRERFMQMQNCEDRTFGKGSKSLARKNLQYDPIIKETTKSKINKWKKLDDFILLNSFNVMTWSALRLPRAFKLLNFFIATWKKYYNIFKKRINFDKFAQWNTNKRLGNIVQAICTIKPTLILKQKTCVLPRFQTRWSHKTS